jgi:small-conductance mechanosensitive channel
MSATEEPSQPTVQPPPKWRRFLHQNLSMFVLRGVPRGPKSTVTEYIEQNGKLITALAVFLSLSVFANTLPDKGAAHLLSFLLFTLGGFVFWELVENFKDFDWYGKIRHFQGVLMLAMFVFAYIYVKMFYHPFLAALVAMVAMVSVMLAAWVLFQTFVRWVLGIPWFRNVNQRAREESIPRFGAATLMVVALFILSHLPHKP